MIRSLHIVIIAVCAALCQAQDMRAAAAAADKPGKAPDGLAAAIARREMARPEKAIRAAERHGDQVSLTLADGTTRTEPLKLVVHSAAAAGAVDVALARRRLEEAAWAAAGLGPDAPASARVAVLDAIARECSRPPLSKTLSSLTQKEPQK